MEFVAKKCCVGHQPGWLQKRYGQSHGEQVYQLILVVMDMLCSFSSSLPLNTNCRWAVMWEKSPTCGLLRDSWGTTMESRMLAKVGFGLIQHGFIFFSLKRNANKSSKKWMSVLALTKIFMKTVIQFGPVDNVWNSAFGSYRWQGNAHLVVSSTCCQGSCLFTLLALISHYKELT